MALMDSQLLVNIGVGVVLAVGGWIGRELWGAMQAMRVDIQRIQIDLPSTYLRRDEFAAGLREIKEMIVGIYTKLDTMNERKADK
ncbi:MAG: hypothetical protein DWI59_06195 [Chloroflexi bacterium]|nr:MAG: hypothetical protein DWI59_06195 [Chloroflexota bacterium]